MSETEYLGARLERDIVKMVEKTAKEENIDKTKALKELIILGRKQLLIQKQIDLYRKGQCSIDKAAEIVGIPVTEMMREAVKAGISSNETIEEYRRGVSILMSG